MTAPQSKSHRTGRRGFTLVELLVVITVIAILVGLLLPAVFGIFKSTGEMTITNDIQRLSAAVEQFKTKHGFYPSDFSEFVDSNGNALAYGDTIPTLDVTVEARLKSFLAKISPQHSEDDDDPVLNDGTSRLQHWWETIGSKLAVFDNAPGAVPNQREARLRGPQVALWFWLSQLYNDAQYPLSGFRLALNSMDNNGNSIPDNMEITSERQVLFEFPNRQLEGIQEVTYASTDGSGLFVVRRFLQPSSPAPYIYFHNATYWDVNDQSLVTFIDFDKASGDTSGTDPQQIGAPCYTKTDPDGDLSTNDFANSETYQIISAGYDEIFGSYNQNINTPGNVSDIEVYESTDNITNFSEGRVDAYLGELFN